MERLEIINRINQRLVKVDESEKIRIYPITKNQEPICKNCKKDNVSLWFCEKCAELFCKDCIKEYKTCGCYNLFQELIFTKISFRKEVN